MAGNLTAMIAAIFSGGVTPDPYFEYTTLLLPGNGTNGAQNNTFLDGSTNNFTITRNGNTTQGTFSPFSQTGWGNYFDGTANGSLRADSTTDTNLSGNFTIQAWVYPTANGQSSYTEIISRGAAATLNGWHFGLTASTTQIYFGLNYGGTGASVYTQSSTNIPLNQWTHVAVTRSGNTCRIYINGVVDTTNTGFTGTPTVSGTEYVYVGRGSYDTTNRQFTGYINNASIIKGTALTTFSQTQPLATSTSGQALLTCTANRFIDTNTATTAKTLTAGSGASVVAFSPFNPTASWSAATNGGSGYFDGSGDYLSATGNAATQMGTGAFTWECWCYILGTSSYQGFIDTRTLPSSGSATGMGLFLNTGTLTPIAATTGTILTSSINVTANSWNHVALTRSSGGTLTIWVNGSSGGTVSNSSNLTDTSIWVGGNSSSPYPAYVNGYLSNVRMTKGADLYTTPFTPPTSPLTTTVSSGTVGLLLNFTNAGIYDATSKNDLETVGNAQISTTQSKWGGSSMSFDGTGDYLLPNGSVTDMFTFGTGEFTVEFWVRYNSGLNVDVALYDSRPTSTNGVYPLLFSNPTGKMVYYVSSAARITGTTTLVAGNWYHVALARSGTSTRLFINGSQEGSTYTDSNNYIVGTNRPAIGAAGIGLGADPLNGYIQDLRVTKGYARYTANFTAPTAAFPTL